MQSLDEVMQAIDLRGVKVWLSGAIPDSVAEVPDKNKRVEVWEGNPNQDGILGFVRSFSAMVFKYGGEIVHGSHPTFTRVLLGQAKRFQMSQTESAALTLMVSDHFRKGNELEWEHWRAIAKVIQTQATGFDSKDRDPSLQVLRDQLANSCNAFVAIGGKWWNEVPGRAGVPIEFELAKKRSVPCFVLGGFGGSSAQYASQNPEWYGELNNGLDAEDNKTLAMLDDFAMAAGIVVAQMQRMIAK